MWNKKKDEEYPPRPASQPAPPAMKESHPPMSSSPANAYVTERGGTPATIGKNVMIKGQISSREDLTIDGEVEGTVELQEHRLTVGPNGKVRATIKARELVVYGAINGNVETTDKIDIRKDARLVGDIRTARIVIEDGAFFKGSIDIVRPDAPKPEVNRPPKQQAPTPPPVTTAAPSAAPPPAPAPAAPVSAGNSGSSESRRP